MNYRLTTDLCPASLWQPKLANATSRSWLQWHVLQRDFIGRYVAMATVTMWMLANCWSGIRTAVWKAPDRPDYCKAPHVGQAAAKLAAAAAPIVIAKQYIPEACNFSPSIGIRIRCSRCPPIFALRIDGGISGNTMFVVRPGRFPPSLIIL